MNDIVPNDLYYDFEEFLKARPVGDDLILMGMAEDGVEVGISTWGEYPSPNLIIENGLPVVKTMVYHAMARVGFSYLVITNRPEEWEKCQNVIVSYMTGADELILQFASYIQHRRDKEIILVVLDTASGVLNNLDFDTKQYLSEIIQDGRRRNVFTVSVEHSEWDGKFGMLVRYINPYWKFEGSESVSFMPFNCSI